MKEHELWKTMNPYLLVSVNVMKRAVAMARQVAIHTDTALVIMQKGKLVPS